MPIIRRRVHDAAEFEFELSILLLAATLEHDTNSLSDLPSLLQLQEYALETELERHCVRIRIDTAAPLELLLSDHASHDPEARLGDQAVQSGEELATDLGVEKNVERRFRLANLALMQNDHVMAEMIELQGERGGDDAFAIVVDRKHAER
jgi:hypothetical protein